MEELRELFFKYYCRLSDRCVLWCHTILLKCMEQAEAVYLDANNYNHTKRNHATIVKLIATLKRATTTTIIYIYQLSQDIWWNSIMGFGECTYVWKFIKMFEYFSILKIKSIKNFEPLNQHQMEQFLSVLTKYRNVCTHGETTVHIQNGRCYWIHRFIKTFIATEWESVWKRKTGFVCCGDCF